MNTHNPSPGVWRDESRLNTLRHAADRQTDRQVVNHNMGSPDPQRPGQMILQLHTQIYWRWSPADHQEGAGRFSYCTNTKTHVVRERESFLMSSNVLLSPKIDNKFSLLRQGKKKL